MKTNTKIELGILAFSLLLSLMFQLYIKSHRNIENFNETVSNENVTIETKLSSFSGIEVGNFTNVEFEYGEPRIEIIADKNLIDKFTQNIDGNILKLRYSGKFMNQKYAPKVKIYSGNPITFLSLENSSKFNYAYRDSSEFMEIILSGGASFTGELVLDSLTISSSDGAQVEIRGHANTLYTEARGGSRLNMEEFTTDYLDLEMSDGATFETRVTGLVNLFTSGGSHATIKGNPRVEKMSQIDGSRIEFIQDK